MAGAGNEGRTGEVAVAGNGGSGSPVKVARDSNIDRQQR